MVTKTVTNVEGAAEAQFLYKPPQLCVMFSFLMQKEFYAQFPIKQGRNKKDFYFQVTEN